MNSTKISNFAKEHPGEPFPRHRSLSAVECDQLRRKLAALYSIESTTDDLVAFTNAIAAKRQAVSRVSDDDRFNLADTLKSLGIVADSEVFLNWHRYDSIDEISLYHASLYFDDIWYPYTDDIDIFDKSCLWIVSVDYHGGVYLARSDVQK